MAVYSITSGSAQPRLQQRIADLYPDNIAWSDRTWLIQSAESASTIAKKLGVGDRDPATGQGSSDFGHLLVTQISSNYWGYGPTAVWDWVKSAFERNQF